MLSSDLGHGDTISGDWSKTIQINPTMTGPTHAQTGDTGIQGHIHPPTVPDVWGSCGGQCGMLDPPPDLLIQT